MSTFTCSRCGHKGPPALTVPERDTVLAALRLWEFVVQQGKDLRFRDIADRLPWLRELAADNGEPLTAEEIDALCDRVNP